jgi:hypothetical protein
MKVLDQKVVPEILTGQKGLDLRPRLRIDLTPLRHRPRPRWLYLQARRRTGLARSHSNVLALHKIRAFCQTREAMGKKRARNPDPPQASFFSL